MGEKYKNHLFKLQVIDSIRFMASSLSNLVDNLAEGIHKVKFKCEHDHIKSEIVEFNTKIVSTVLNTDTLKMT